MILIFFQLLSQPRKSLFNSFVLQHTYAIYTPSIVLNIVESKLFYNFFSGYATFYVLLVGQDQKNAIFNVLLSEQLSQFLFRGVKRFSVRWVNYKNNSLSSLVITFPYLSQALLSAQIPCLQVHVMSLYFLVIRSYCRMTFDYFTKFSI